MKFKNLLLLLVLISAATTSFSQTAKEIPSKPTKIYNGPSGHAIGAILSSTNGKGLAYRYWKNKYGFHASFFPAASNNDRYYNVGLTGYCKLREYEPGTLFLHAGAEYAYSTSNRYEYVSAYNSYSYLRTTNGVNFGFGPGMHFTQKFVSMDVFVGYGGYYKEESTDNVLHPPTHSFVATLTGGIALFLEL